MKRILTLTLLLGLGGARIGAAATPASAPAAATTTTTADAALTRPYEAIRVALLHDSFKDVARQAAELAAAAGAQAGSKAPRAAAKSATTRPAANPLRDLATAATALGRTKDLAGAREAFWPVSQAMIAWHAARTEDGNVVVFCPMVQQSWLQPKGEIGNPYYGQSMAKCGQIVPK